MATRKTGNSQSPLAQLATAVVCTASFLLTPNVASSADNPETKPLDIKLGARVRFEAVDFAGNHGSAFTTKLRLKTHYKANDWQLFSEIDYVESLLRSDHSDGVTLSNEPVIADPRGIEFNQAFARHKRGNSKFTLGRQQLIFEDHRLVGSVGFRQNSQSYDGLRLEHKFVSGWKVDYAYINRVNRIFGRNAKESLNADDIRFAQLGGLRPTGLLGRHRVDGHLIHFAGRVHDYLKVFAVGQVIHNEDHSPFSNRTIMIGGDASYKSGKVKWQSSILLAKQRKQETALDDWLTFTRLEAGATIGEIQLSFRQERFGSKLGQSFITPLATLHKFQGWADRFLNTPPDGLRDNSVLLKWRRLPVIIDARFHRYESERNSAKIGDELNLDFIYRFKRGQEVKLRFADFEPEAGSNQIPVQKLFLMFTHKL